MNNLIFIIIYLLFFIFFIDELLHNQPTKFSMCKITKAIHATCNDYKLTRTTDLRVNCLKFTLSLNKLLHCQYYYSLQIELAQKEAGHRSRNAVLMSQPFIYTMRM